MQSGPRPPAFHARFLLQAWLLEDSLNRTGGLSLPSTASTDGSSASGTPFDSRKGFNALFASAQHAPPQPDGQFHIIKLQAQRKRDIAESAAGSLLQGALEGLAGGNDDDDDDGQGGSPRRYGGGDIGPTAAAASGAMADERLGKLAGRLSTRSERARSEVGALREMEGKVPTYTGVSTGDWAHQAGEGGLGSRDPAATTERRHLASFQLEMGDVQPGQKADAVLRSGADAERARRRGAGGSGQLQADIHRNAASSQHAGRSMDLLSEQRVRAIQSAVGPHGGGEYVLRPSGESPSGVAEMGPMGQAKFEPPSGLFHGVGHGEGKRDVPPSHRWQVSPNAPRGQGSALHSWGKRLTELPAEQGAVMSGGPIGEGTDVVAGGRAGSSSLLGYSDLHAEVAGGVRSAACAPAVPPPGMGLSVAVLSTGAAATYGTAGGAPSLGFGGRAVYTPDSGGHMGGTMRPFRGMSAQQVAVMRAEVTADIIQQLRRHMQGLSTRDRMRLMLADAIARTPSAFVVDANLNGDLTQATSTGAHPHLGTVEQLLEKSTRGGFTEQSPSVTLTVKNGTRKGGEWGSTIISTSPSARQAASAGARRFGQGVDDAATAARQYLSHAVRGAMDGPTEGEAMIMMSSAMTGPALATPTVILPDKGGQESKSGGGVAWAAVQVLGDTENTAPALFRSDGLLRFLYSRMAADRAQSIRRGGGLRGGSGSPEGAYILDAMPAEGGYLQGEVDSRAFAQKLSRDLPLIHEDERLRRAETTAVTDAANRGLVMLHVLLADIRTLQWRACNPQGPPTIEPRGGLSQKGPRPSAGGGYVYGGKSKTAEAEARKLPPPPRDIHKGQVIASMSHLLGPHSAALYEHDREANLDDVYGLSDSAAVGGDSVDAHIGVARDKKSERRRNAAVNAARAVFSTPHKLRLAATEGGLPVSSTVNELIAMSNLPAQLWAHVDAALRKIIERVPAALRIAYEERESARLLGFSARVQLIKSQFGADLASAQAQADAQVGPLQAKVRSLERALEIARTQIRRARVQASQAGFALTELAPKLTRDAIQGVLQAVYGGGTASSGGDGGSPRGSAGAKTSVLAGWGDDDDDEGLEGGGVTPLSPVGGNALSRLRRGGGTSSPRSTSHQAGTSAAHGSGAPLTPMHVSGRQPDGSFHFQSEEAFLKGVVELLSDDAMTGGDVSGNTSVGRSVQNNPLMRAIAGKIRDLAEKAHTSLYEREELVRSLTAAQEGTQAQLEKIRKQLVASRWQAAASYGVLHRKYAAMAEEVVTLQREASAREAALEEEVSLLTQTLDIVQQRERKRATGRLTGSRGGVPDRTEMLKALFGVDSVQLLYDLAGRMQEAADAGLPIVIAAREGGAGGAAAASDGCGSAAAGAPTPPDSPLRMSAQGAARAASELRRAAMRRGILRTAGSARSADEDGEEEGASTAGGSRGGAGSPKKRRPGSKGKGAGKRAKGGVKGGSDEIPPGSLLLNPAESALLFGVLVAGGVLADGADIGQHTHSGMAVTPHRHPPPTPGRGRGALGERVPLNLARVVSALRGDSGRWGALGGGFPGGDAEKESSSDSLDASKALEEVPSVMSDSKFGWGEDADGAWGGGLGGASLPGANQSMVGDAVDLRMLNGGVKTDKPPPPARLSVSLARDDERAHWGVRGGSAAGDEVDFGFEDSMTAPSLAENWRSAARAERESLNAVERKAPSRTSADDVDPVPAGSDSEMEVPRAQGGQGGSELSAADQSQPSAEDTRTANDELEAALEEEQRAARNTKVAAARKRIAKRPAATNPSPQHAQTAAARAPAALSDAHSLASYAQGVISLKGGVQGPHEGGAADGREDSWEDADAEDGTQVRVRRRVQFSGGNDAPDVSEVDDSAPLVTPLASRRGVNKVVSQTATQAAAHHRQLMRRGSKLRPAAPEQVAEIGTRTGVPRGAAYRKGSGRRAGDGSPRSDDSQDEHSGAQDEHALDAGHPDGPIDPRLSEELQRAERRRRRREQWAAGRLEGSFLSDGELETEGGEYEQEGGEGASHSDLQYSDGDSADDSRGRRSALESRLASDGEDMGPPSEVVGPSIPPGMTPQQVAAALDERRAQRKARRARKGAKGGKGRSKLVRSGSGRSVTTGVTSTGGDGSSIGGPTPPGDSPQQASHMARLNARPYKAVLVRGGLVGAVYDFHTGSTGSSGSDSGAEGGVYFRRGGGTSPGDAARRVGFNMSKNETQHVEYPRGVWEGLEGGGPTPPGGSGGWQATAPIQPQVALSSEWNVYESQGGYKGGLRGVAVSGGTFGRSLPGAAPPQPVAKGGKAVPQPGVLMPRPGSQGRVPNTLNMLRTHGVPEGQLLEEAMRLAVGGAEQPQATEPGSPVPRERFLFPSGKGGRDGTGMDLHFLTLDAQSGFALVVPGEMLKGSKGGSTAVPPTEEPDMHPVPQVMVGGSLTCPLWDAGSSHGDRGTPDRPRVQRAYLYRPPELYGGPSVPLFDFEGGQDAMQMIAKRTFAEFQRNTQAMSQALLSAAALQGVDAPALQHWGLGLSVKALAKVGQEGSDTADWTDAIGMSHPAGGLASISQLPGILRGGVDLPQLRSDAGRLHQAWVEAEHARVTALHAKQRSNPTWSDAEQRPDGTPLQPWFRLDARGLSPEEVMTLAAAVEAIARMGREGGIRGFKYTRQGLDMEASADDANVNGAAGRDTPPPLTPPPRSREPLTSTVSPGVSLGHILGRPPQPGSAAAPLAVGPPRLAGGSSVPELTLSRLGGGVQGGSTASLGAAAMSHFLVPPGFHGMSLSSRLRHLKPAPASLGGGGEGLRPAPPAHPLAMTATSVAQSLPVRPLPQRDAGGTGGSGGSRGRTSGTFSGRGGVRPGAGGVVSASSVPPVSALGGDLALGSTQSLPRGRALSSSASARTLPQGLRAGSGVAKWGAGGSQRSTSPLLRPAPGLSRSGSAVLFGPSIHPNGVQGGGSPGTPVCMPSRKGGSRSASRGPSAHHLHASRRGAGLGGGLSTGSAFKTAVGAGLLAGTRTTAGGVVQFGTSITRWDGSDSTIE